MGRAGTGDGRRVVRFRVPEIHASSSRPGGVRGRGDVARVRDGSSRDARTHPENSLVFAPICTCSSSPTTVSHSSSSPGRSEEDVVVEKKRGRRPSRDDDDDDAGGGGIEPRGSDARVEMIAASLDRDASAWRSIRDASRHDRAISGALRTGAPVFLVWSIGSSVRSQTPSPSSANHVRPTGLPCRCHFFFL